MEISTNFFLFHDHDIQLRMQKKAIRTKQMICLLMGRMGGNHAYIEAYNCLLVTQIFPYFQL